MAGRWEQFEKDGDRYLLQYRTVGDERVRQEHDLLNRVTLPLSSSFGDEHFPPNGWNCRCSVVQVRKGKYPETDLNEAYQRAEASSAKDTKGMFRFNVGKEGKTIPDYNPYTIKDCKGCKVAKGNLAWSPNRQFCRVCNMIRDCCKERAQENAKNLHKLSVAEKQAIYRKPIDEQFEEVFQTEKGVVLRHFLKDKESEDYDRVLNTAILFAEKNR